MRLGSRVIVLLLTALAAGSICTACGGKSEEDQIKGTSEEDRKGKRGKNQNNGKRDKDQIKEVANEFFAAASRGDYGDACSLYAPEGLAELGGQSGCVAFYKMAHGAAFDFGRPEISKVTIAGNTGLVAVQGLGYFMEMDLVNGKWFVDEVAGY
jgi:hypothetical protein